MRALLLADLQNDFMPWGALPVRNGHEAISVANRLQRAVDLVVAIQDWHPRDHCSFASQHEGGRPGDVLELDGLEQVLWPDHCVQGTSGAALVPGLDTTHLAHVVHKGTDPSIDAYSAFFDNGHRHSTGLGEWLAEHGIDEVWVTGVATDYCVRATSLDALRLGFRVVVVEDGCRGVDLTPGDSARALEELRAAGASVVQSADLLRTARLEYLESGETYEGR